MPRITDVHSVFITSCTFLVLFTQSAAIPAAEIDRYGYMSRLVSLRSLSGQCTITVKPDEASITVGLDGEGDTPDEARKAMDSLGGKIRTLVSQHRGRIQEHEMVRMMRSGDPAPVVQPGMSATPSAPTPGKIFFFSQRLDLEFPLSADVDAILLGLNKAGVVRIGRQTMMAGYSGRHLSHTPPQPVVFYGFREPEKMAERAHQQCRLEAIEKWCQTQAAGDQIAECIGEMKRILGRLMTQSMSLRATSTGTGYPGSGNFQVSFPFQPATLQHMMLLGREPVELTGSINLRFTGPSW